ncbi:MAG: glycosyltransferase family 4 protein [Tepidisphaeraceae bacterium]
MNRWLSENAPIGAFDLLIGRYVTPVTKLRALERQRRYVDADDFVYRYVPSADGWHAKAFAHARSAARLELSRRALARFDHVWMCSPRDLQLAALSNSSLLPNVVHVPTHAPRAPAASCQSILFVGSLWYEPNRHAVDWFLKNCWPAIRRTLPEASLRLVGATSADVLKRWQSVAGVSAPGFIADLAVEYEACAFTIAPIWFGGGTQIKVLESLAFSRAAVVSRFVGERYGNAFADGQSLALASNAEEMIERCLSLLRNPSMAADLARNGHETVQGQFTWPAFRAAVLDSIATAASERRVPIS